MRPPPYSKNKLFIFEIGVETRKTSDFAKLDSELSRELRRVLAHPLIKRRAIRLRRADRDEAADWEGILE